MTTATTRKWWQEATGYQIWPASFSDSNDDGIGDLEGITGKLDYLVALGVDLLWLSPVYDSPQHDMGYDIRNYEDIWDRYGTLADMETLIKECKERNIRTIMDLVINHTSSEHPWFLESKSSRTNDKADWYIWRDPKTGPKGERCEPNNWRAAFGGSVWTYAEERDQYYLHLALPEQPDLNWQNAQTRQVLYESAVDFWLRRGIDGFRMDVVNFYWKDPTFPDANVTVSDQLYQPMEPQHILNGRDVHGWLKELHGKISRDHGNDVFLIGELPATGSEEILKYISSDSEELSTIFDFDALIAGNDWNAPLHDRKEVQLSLFKRAIEKTQAYVNPEGKTWPTTFLESHDFPRSVAHFGPGEGRYREQAAKMLALLNTTLSGTLFIYQGQELGMTNVPNHWTRQHFRDKAVLRYFDEIDQAHPDDEEMQKRALQGAIRHGRDNARTPVQWTNETHAGFSAAEPWIPVNDNFHALNAAAQEQNELSVLSFWKKMLKLRKYHSNIFVRGEFSMVDAGSDHVFAFVKSDPTTRASMIVVLNFSGEEVRYQLPAHLTPSTMSMLVRTHGSSEPLGAETLGPWEGVVYTSAFEESTRS